MGAPVDYTKDLSPKAEDLFLRFTIHQLFTYFNLIGFDRSAFVARPHGAGRQLKNEESSSCSIHDEGLPERPIKS